MSSEKIPIIIIGAQLHGNAGNVLELLEETCNYKVVGFLDNAKEFQDKTINGIPVLGQTDNLEHLDLPTKNFHIAIGDNYARRDISERLKALGNNLITLIHPKAIVSKIVAIGEGCYIGPGVIIRRDVHIGPVSIIDAGSIIGTNTEIGSAVSILSSVDIDSDVKIDDCSFIGMGAKVLSGISIGAGVLIDVNTIVRKNVPSGTTMKQYTSKEYPKNIFTDADPDITSSKKVYVAQPTLPNYSLVDEKFRKIFESRILSNFAHYSNQLELNVQRLLSVDKALTFPNCTSALMIAVKMLNLSGEVILPSFTFAATGHAVVWNGLKPVFADIDLHTFNIDPDDVESKITDKTSAIMAVHIFGNPCEIDRLEDIAKRYNLKLIFDSAHALGSQYNGKSIGSFGDVELFSLSGTKVITSAEGGIATSNNIEFMERMSLGRNYGAGNDYNCLFMGLNGKMSEFHAAIAIESLLLLSDSLYARNKIVSLYTKRLSEIPGISFQYVPDQNMSTYKDFAIIIDKDVFGIDRDELITNLRNEDIYPNKYFYPPLHEMSIYKSINHKAEGLENTAKVSNNIICLPIFSHMNIDTVEKICFTIYRIWEKIS